MKILTLMASRFVAGETAEEAVSAIRKLNKRGISATLDFLGEECQTLSMAADATREIRRLFKLIHDHQLDANVSIKATQLGLNLDPVRCRENVLSIVDEAAKYGNYVRIDMEGSPYTQLTLDLFLEVFKTRKNVGLVLQSMLRRTKSDLETLIKAGARVRLCKGAYKEPYTIAFVKKEEVNEAYDACVRRMLDSGLFHAIATHDDVRIANAVKYAKAKGIPKHQYEFQMLFGLRSKLWTELVHQGHKVRIYVPYGTHWFPYFYRRLRERKENMMFVLKNLFS